MAAYTYLLVNFLTVIICFIFSFDRRIQFNRYFSAFLKGSALVAGPFIIWDIWFARTGVWWFNSKYTLGWQIADLPFEEWLFFICIPFSCVFTYFCLDKFFDLSWTNRSSRTIVWITVVVCLSVAILYSEKLYPLVTALITAGTVLLLFYVAKADWVGRASLVFLVLMLGFFPVNGVLTGTGLESPVVNYNPQEILNVRMLTIPVEDAVYGYTLFLLNLYFFKLFSGRINKSTSSEK